MKIEAISEAEKIKSFLAKEEEREKARIIPNASEIKHIQDQYPNIDIKQYAEYLQKVNDKAITGKEPEYNDFKKARDGWLQSKKIEYLKNVNKITAAVVPDRASNR